ncbi:MAG: hypothetical protein ISP55_07375 [Flavobacteriales bacterium]|nr:hypothetical protein [Flavobacteriales bacterium]
MSDGPQLTLAIPVRDDGHEHLLRRTLDSIHQVLYEADIEVLVQVGKTAPKIKALTAAHPAAPRHFQADDTGIYDAMNRLIEHATGERILFLGAGDIPLAGLSRALDRWNTVDESLELGGVRIPNAELRVPRHYSPRWDKGLRWRNVCHHQGIAYPLSLLRTLGGFPTEYAVLGDYALNLEMWQEGIKARWTQREDWVSAAPGGVSRNFNAALYAEEREMKARILRPGLAKWSQPLWIRLKSRWKSGA